MFIKIGSRIINEDHIIDVNLAEPGSYVNTAGEPLPVPTVAIYLTGDRQLFVYHETAEAVREYFESGGLAETEVVAEMEMPRIPNGGIR